MNTYEVPGEVFFSRPLWGNTDYLSRIKVIDQCGAGMRQLIDRYDLKGKRIASIGAGEGFEECHLYRYGQCELIMVDKDEGGTIERLLRKMDIYVANEREFNRSSAVDEQRKFRYVVADFFDLTPADRGKVGLAELDAVYFSGFAPDEERRQRLARRSNVTARLMSRFRRSRGLIWPEAEDAFHPRMISGAQQMLKEGGLLIVQSYYGGVHIEIDDAYVGAMQRQLTAHGLALVEIWSFVEWPGIALYVAVKGDAAAYVRTLQERPHLTEFFSRAEVEKRVHRVYVAGSPASTLVA